MGVEILWDDQEQRIMKFVYGKKWTWEEALAALKEANTMMDKTSHGFKIVSIVDMSASGFMPKEAAMNIRNMIRQSMSHNNSGISVFIQADRVVKLMIEILQKSYPDLKDFSNFLYASNLVEAREIAAREVKRLEATK